MSQELPFKISSNLKNIIGKDLINDRYIAVFELVKNSYDAGAKKVDIIFEDLKSPNAKITIFDNGDGMSYDDLVNKWLFVAYSEKNTKNIKKTDKDYREKIKRHYAGAKGVGRFSCDRLGKYLKMTTTTKGSNMEHVLFVDWSKFEENDENEFIKIHVEYTVNNKTTQWTGTKIEISGLRENWIRDNVLTLKKSLVKLISPQDDNKEDSFGIFIDAKEFINEDTKVIEENKKNDVNNYTYDLVNGEIVNNIFDKLSVKTTNLVVKVSQDGSQIETALHDRDVFVFSFTEENKFDLLKNVSCKLYYMNRAAKVNFTRQMGVEPINYGSIFIYKNSFRVYPYGEPGRDFFDIDKRKSQGYNRYFGTRSLMGNIRLIGFNDNFNETTSRDGGFIRNDAVEQLESFFMKSLKVLEKYVVEGIDWGDPNKEDFVIDVNDQGLMPEDVKESVIQQFASITSQKMVISSKINPKLISNPELKKESKFKSLIGSLNKIQEKVEDGDREAFANIIKNLENESELINKRKKEAEQETEHIEEQLNISKKEIEARKRQQEANYKKIDKNVLYLEDGYHLVFKYAKGIAENINYLMNKYKKDNELMDILNEIFISNKRIQSLSDLSIKGKHDVKGRKPTDLVEYIRAYIKNHSLSKKRNIDIKTSDKDYKIVSNFTPYDISILIDNMLDNSEKNGAKNIEIFLEKNKDIISIIFYDDGRGLEDANPESIFELSYSRTGGTGLGLDHVRRIARENGGDVKNIPTEKGFKIQVRIKYESNFSNTMV